MKTITAQEIQTWEPLKDPADPGKVLENPLLKERIEEIITYQGDRTEPCQIPTLYFHEFAEFEKSGNRLIYEEPYFFKRSLLVTRGLVAWLYQNEKESDVTSLTDVMWSICDEYTWALPAHVHGGLETDRYTVDLFAAETACCLAELLHYIPKLPELVRERVRVEIFRRVLTPFLTQKEKFPFENMENNWCAVCGGSVGIAALYLLEDPKQLEIVLNRVGESMDRFLNSFSADGACLEGLSYWTYGMSFFVSYCELLYRRSGGQVELMASERVHQIARFQQQCYFSGGRTISFSDGSTRDHFYLGLTSYLRRYYGDIVIPPKACMASYTDDSCYRWVTLFRDLIWSDSRIEDWTQDALSVFSDAQWWILRDGDKGIAAKGGHNGESHNHNDIGSFLIYRGEEELLADLGAGEYTKQYFREETRYQIFCNGSQGHSVPEIQGQRQAAGAGYRAENVQMGEKSFSLEMAGAYPAGMVKSLHRTLDYESSGHLILTDTFVFGEDSKSVIERFVSRKPIRQGDKKGEIWIGDMRVCCSEGLSGMEAKTVCQKDHKGEDEMVFLAEFLFHPQQKDTAYAYRFDFYF